MSDRYTIYKNTSGSFFGEPFYDWRAQVFQEFAAYLCSRGMDVRVEDRETFEVKLARTDSAEITIRDSLGIMQNERTGQYFVLDCHDMVRTADLELLVRDARCLRILKCQYTDLAFSKPVHARVRPWTYFDRFWPRNEQRIVAARRIPRTVNGLYFRGAGWGDRGCILTELSKRGIINADFNVIDSDVYLNEITRHRLMLSLPGYAELCHRDVECFGSGTCVLRPRLHTRFHNDLVPDYHYVSVDIPCTDVEPVEVADRIERRFREVVDDPAYLAFVAGNAARWYDENVRRGAAVRLTARLLGLEEAGG